MLITALLALMIAGTASAQVRWGVDVHFGTPGYYPPPPPPPPVIYEPPPPCPYEVGVWQPGAWRYDYGYRRYRWNPGSWQRREWREERFEHRRFDREDDQGEHRWHDNGRHRGWYKD